MLRLPREGRYYYFDARAKCANTRYFTRRQATPQLSDEATTRRAPRTTAAEVGVAPLEAGWLDDVRLMGYLMR